MITGCGASQRLTCASKRRLQIRALPDAQPSAIRFRQQFCAARSRAISEFANFSGRPWVILNEVKNPPKAILFRHPASRGFFAPAACAQNDKKERAFAQSEGKGAPRLTHPCARCGLCLPGRLFRLPRPPAWARRGTLLSALSPGRGVRGLRVRSSAGSRADPRPVPRWPPTLPAASSASASRHTRSTRPSRIPAP